jgi:transmembrane sensor
MSRQVLKAQSAAEIQMSASRWVIERRDAENWTDENQEKLDAWLNESSAHAIAYWRASHAWGRTYRIAALKRPAAENPLPKREAKRSTTIFKIAMALYAFAVAGWTATMLFAGPKFTNYATPVGGHRVLVLSNGSKIELNTDSVLRLSDGAAVLEKGEAYFEIKHDAAHPFVVSAGGRKIVDVGTKFLVRNGADHLEVALFEGRVLLGAPDGSKTAPSKLAAGDVAIATANSISIVKRPLRALANEVSWRQGVLIFHRTSLADAAAEFNRYNSRKLIVADADAARLKIDGKFRTNDVASFTEVAEDVLRLRIERQGNQTVMSR